MRSLICGEWRDVDIKVGGRLRSTVCGTEVIVVRSAASEIDLRCGGYAMVPRDAAGTPGPAAEGPQAGLDGGTQIGKRYLDEGSGLELLVTKAGAGTLSLGDVPLPVKQAKPLPSSD